MEQMRRCQGTLAQAQERLLDTIRQRKIFDPVVTEKILPLRLSLELEDLKHVHILKVPE